MVEGDPTAPVNAACWHPYDKVIGNDANDGKFYDFAIDGVLTTITTPTFVDGYDYMIRWAGISHNGGSQSFRIAGGDLGTFTNSSVSGTGTLEILMPTLEDYPKAGWVHHRVAALGSNGPFATDDAAATNFNGRFGFTNLATALTSIAFTFSAGGGFDAGKFFLYRRRNYISG
jgi:hypothetical protein